MITLGILSGVLTSVLAVCAVRDLTSVGRARRRAVQAAEASSNRDMSSLVADLNGRLRKTRPGRWLEREMELAGMTHSPLTVFGVAGVVLLVVCYALWNFLAPLLAVLGVAVVVIAVRAYLRRAQQRRREAFIAQLPELARVLANASFAGLALPTALSIAGDELADPAKSELGLVATRLRFGAPMSTALEELRRRVGSRETNVLISTLLVSSRSGGSLVTALRSIGDTLEQRKETRREIRSILAQPIATSYTVVGLGVAMLLLLNGMKPGTVDAMTRSGVGQVTLVLAGTIFVGGFILIRRMTKFDL